jgi:hypothetical protein
MALDYISAKVAVSSNDLRRATPFRRKTRTPTNFGPTIPETDFLRSPLFIAKDDYPDLPSGTAFEPDPQGTWYAMLAGSTGLLPDNCAKGAANGQGNFGEAMVFAGLHDYRVPDLILDLFVNPTHRAFYQKIQHHHANGVVEDVAVEIYAGSPSYLITAGGSPTGFCYLPVFFGITSSVGSMDDLGAVMPTTFMPTGYGLTLESMIQIGRYTDLFAHNELVVHHLGVVRDFACGAGVWIPGEINSAENERYGPWTFFQKGTDGGAQGPGYYLALYNGAYYGDDVALLEAFDTWLNPGLKFHDFKSFIIDSYGKPQVRFSHEGVNTYTTKLGQVIQFTISPRSEIVSSSWWPEPPFNGQFAYGDVIKSDQGSGVVTISNPARPGQQIVLDMQDVNNPTRTSESGEVETAGFQAHKEVWVDFNSPFPPGPDGDFYRPFKTLVEAITAVADGGTIKILPGTTSETLIQSNKRIKIVAPIGGVTISGH